MKIRAFLAAGLTASVAALALVPRAGADNTDNKNVDVTVALRNSLTISATNLAMPDIVKPDTGGPTAQVTLACDATSDASNSVTYTQRSNPFARGVSKAGNHMPDAASNNLLHAPGVNATGTCANITVNGQPNFYFFATLSGVTNPTATGVELNRVDCIEANVGTFSSGGAPQSIQLGSSGSSLIRCGGIVKVANTATATSYTDGRFTITVVYD